MRTLLVAGLLLGMPAPAWAWNATGHLVSARLARRQLSDARRAHGAALEAHPHYATYLAAERREGFGEDDGAFLRAATWADWVRGGSGRDYSRPSWHYINLPIVPPGSALDAAKVQPPPDQENVVRQLGVSAEKIRAGTAEEKAVYLTWLFHLVGDIHQPLHCTAVFSERFPTGDRGGNLALIRVRSSPVNLHSFWDGLLGTGTTAGDIGRDVAEIEAVMEQKAEEVRKEVGDHTTFESWAREGEDLARRVVYLDGDLRVAVSGSGEDVPPAPEDYAPNCGRVARVQIGKASLRLAEQLKALFP